MGPSSGPARWWPRTASRAPSTSACPRGESDERSFADPAAAVDAHRADRVDRDRGERRGRGPAGRAGARARAGRGLPAGLRACRRGRDVLDGQRRGTRPGGAHAGAEPGRDRHRQRVHDLADGLAAARAVRVRGGGGGLMRRPACPRGDIRVARYASETSPSFSARTSSTSARRDRRLGVRGEPDPAPGDRALRGARERQRLVLRRPGPAAGRPAGGAEPFPAENLAAWRVPRRPDRRHSHHRPAPVRRDAGVRLGLQARRRRAGVRPVPTGDRHLEHLPGVAGPVHDGRLDKLARQRGAAVVRGVGACRVRAGRRAPAARHLPAAHPGPAAPVPGGAAV